ncbi:hypothetical protein G7Y79_00047g082990 [Physcia stellaris]|nr:hypothetical protein G7Y79_00047g082990 [Physcia stellaris]
MSISPPVVGNASFELPVELVQQILKKLPRRDLKSLRLTSKALAEQATYLTFNAVFLSPDPVDIEKTARVFATFKSSITTLILSPFFIGELTLAQYKRCVERGGQFKSYLETFPLHMPLRFPYRSRFAEHIKMGYEDLKSRRQVEHTPTRQLLCSILQHAHNIRKLIITDRRRAMDLTGLELAKFCRWEDCTIPPDMHAMFRPTPAQAKEDWGPDILTAFYKVVFKNGSRLRELSVEQTEKEYSGYRMTARDIFGRLDFDPHARASTTTSTLQAKTFLATLTTLKLDVDAKPYKYEHPIYCVFRELAGYLAQAQSVEVLALRVLTCGDDEETLCPYASSFDRILRDCHFPRLRTFSLSDCSMTYNDLLAFLTSSPNISTLSFHSCILTTACWMHVLEYIKERSQIRTLSLHDIEGRFGVNGEFGLVFNDDNGSVENFLLRNGPNPFDSERLQA